MPSEPRFSILMPTRNRARLLRMALQSALELQGADFEVVVSDNCSSDDTPAVVQESGDPRVRYVRTPRPLPISENMESLLDHARGEYLIFLNDDDALPASALQRAGALLDATGAEVLAWPYCQYFHPEWHEARPRNHLLIWPYAETVEDIPAHRVITAVYQLNPARMPNWTNAIQRRSVVERARREVPRLFPALIAFDVFGAVALLTVTRRLYWVDLPLMIIGKWSGSVGSSIFVRRRRSAPAYAQEFPAEAQWRHAPLRAFTVGNLHAEALLQAKATLGARLDAFELDWSPYFVRCFLDLVYQYTQGTDVAADLAEFRDVLAARPEALRSSVAAAIRAAGFTDGPTWRQTARRLVNQLPLLARALSLLEPPLQAGGGGRVISGRDAGFTNILECAHAWDRELAKRPTSAVTLAP